MAHPMSFHEFENKKVVTMKMLLNNQFELWDQTNKCDKVDTLPETNIAPKNRSSQKESSIPTIHFQVLC